MKTKVITVTVLVFASFLLVGAWKVFLGPFPSFNYQSLVVPGGIKFSSSGLFISGHEMGYDSIYGYLYDADRNILFHMDSFLMAGNYVEHQTESIKTESNFVDTDDIIVKDVKSDTSNFGIIYRYVITAKNISKESRESLKDITLYVTFESLEDFGLFSTPNYVNFVSSLNDTSEIENHLSLFKTASTSE